jgi:hypothetical protein
MRLDKNKSMTIRKFLCFCSKPVVKMDPKRESKHIIELTVKIIRFVINHKFNKE